MVRKALSQRVVSDVQAKKDRSEQIEDRKELQEKTRGWPKPLFMQSDVKYKSTVLHTLDQALDLLIHVVKRVDAQGNVRWVKRVCNKQYVNINPDFAHCEDCETKIEGRNNNPYPAKVLVAYVHSLENKTWDPPGGDGPKPLNPIKLIEVRYGKGGTNVDVLIDKASNGLFNKDTKLWIFSKTGQKKDTVYLPPELASKDDYPDEGPFDLPADVAASYLNQSDDFYAQRIGCGYENFRFDLWEVPDPRQTVSAGSSPQKAVEAAEPKSKPKAKGALS